MIETLTPTMGMPASRIGRLRLSYAAAKSVSASIDATRMSQSELVDHVMSGYEEYTQGKLIDWEDFKAEFETRYPRS